MLFYLIKFILRNKRSLVILTKHFDEVSKRKELSAANYCGMKIVIVCRHLLDIL